MIECFTTLVVRSKREHLPKPGYPRNGNHIGLGFRHFIATIFFIHNIYQIKIKLLTALRIWSPRSRSFWDYIQNTHTQTVQENPKALVCIASTAPSSSSSL